MSTLKTRFGALVLLSTAGYLVSFFSQLVIAYHFGTSKEMDTYWVGLALVNMVSFYSSPLKEALVPVIHRAQQLGDAQAGRVLSAGLSLLLALMAVSGALLWLLSAGVAGWPMAGSIEVMSGGVFELLPWLLVYLFMLVLAETLNSTLVSLNQVLRQALVRIFAALVLLGTISTLGSSMGVSGLLVAQIFGMATLLFTSWLALRHFRIRFLMRAWPVLRGTGMFPLFASLLISYFFAQLYVMAERSAMVHMGAGLVSCFQYSVTLVNVLVSLLAYPLSNLLWSQFLIRAADGDLKQSHTLAIRACGLLFYVLSVVCVFIWCYAREIIELVYARGAFDETSVQLTSEALRATIFAAIPISIGSILGRLLVSSFNARVTVLAGLVSTTVGLTVLGLSLVYDSKQLIMTHWIFSNTAGALTAVLFFTRIYRPSSRELISFGKWIFQMLIIIFISIWITSKFKISYDDSDLLMLLLTQGSIYYLAIFLLTISLPIGNDLRKLIRNY